MTAAMQSALKEALEKSQKKREEEYHRNLSTVKVRGARAFTRQGLSGTPEHRPRHSGWARVQRCHWTFH